MKLQLPMYANAGEVHVRDRADIDGTSLKVIHINKELLATAIDEKTGSWARVKIDGVEGWCSLKDLMPAGGMNAPWLAFAQSEIGVNDTSPNGPTRIIEYMADVGKLSKAEKNDPGTDWCACFIDFCMKENSLRRMKSPRAKDWLKWGSARPAGNGRLPVGARVGDIAVGERGKKGGSEGHVAIFLAYDKENDLLLLLGGNQSKSPLEPGEPKAVRYTWYPRESKKPYGKFLSLRHLD